MSESPWRWTKRSLVAMAGCAAVGAGAAGTTVGEESRAHFFSMGVASLGLFWWCWVDARMRATPIPHGIVFVMAFTWPLSAMIYLIWSRGLRGLGITLLTVIVMIVLVGAGGLVAQIMTI